MSMFIPFENEEIEALNSLVDILTEEGSEEEEWETFESRVKTALDGLPAELAPSKQYLEGYREGVCKLMGSWAVGGWAPRKNA